MMINFVSLVLMMVGLMAFRAGKSYAGPSEGVLGFYPHAAAVTQHPPEIDDLRKLCEHKIDGLYASLWGVEPRKPQLVVFHKSRINQLTNVVTLKIRYNPAPTARVSQEGSLDWGYVFDRNSDGLFDYVAFLSGARPVEGTDFPSDYPKGGLGVKISFKDLELTIKSGRLVFKHYADDNFDGSADAVVAPIPDLERPFWIRSYGVLRSTGFNGTVDEDWVFVEDIVSRKGRIPKTAKGYMMVNAEPPQIQEGDMWLADGTSLLKMINETVKQCGWGNLR